MKDINETLKRATSAREVEDVMFSYAAEQRRADETSEQAFARLVADGDQEINKALAALDQMRTASTMKCASVSKRCADQLDRHVEAERRADETAADAYARLAADPTPTFAELYSSLREVRDLPG